MEHLAGNHKSNLFNELKVQTKLTAQTPFDASNEYRQAAECKPSIFHFFVSSIPVHRRFKLLRMTPKLIWEMFPGKCMRLSLSAPTYLFQHIIQNNGMISFIVIPLTRL